MVVMIHSILSTVFKRLSSKLWTIYQRLSDGIWSGFIQNNLLKTPTMQKNSNIGELPCNLLCVVVAVSIIMKCSVLLANDITIYHMRTNTVTSLTMCEEVCVACHNSLVVYRSLTSGGCRGLKPIFCFTSFVN